MKDFIIMASINVVTYKEVFPLIKDETIMAGAAFDKSIDFVMPDGSFKAVNIGWLTTFQIEKEKKLVLSKRYTPEEYPKYDNYDAINVNKLKDIPVDYFGVMGVPVTFIGYFPNNIEIHNEEVEEYSPNISFNKGGIIKHNSNISCLKGNQFEIVWTSDRGGDGKIEYLKNKSWNGLWDSCFVGGNKVYKRIFIKRVS